MFIEKKGNKNKKINIKFLQNNEHTELIHSAKEYLTQIGFYGLKEAGLKQGVANPDIIGFAPGHKALAVECGNLNLKLYENPIKRIESLLERYDILIHVPFPKLKFGILIYELYIYENYNLVNNKKDKHKFEQERIEMKKQISELEKEYEKKKNKINDYNEIKNFALSLQYELCSAPREHFCHKCHSCQTIERLLSAITPKEKTEQRP